ncbi:peptidyl-prolyl cis-trans isomerase [Thermaurantiacus sp.]
MLQSLRKGVTSWVGLLLLGIVVVAMVVTLFYGQAPAPPRGGGRAVATVGRTSVGEGELVRLANTALEAERQRRPELTMPQFVRLGGLDLVLDQLLVARAIDAFAERAGVPVGRRLVDGEIASLPAAQVGGRFDDNAFRRFLQQQQLSEAEIRDSLASDLRRRAILTPAAIGLSAPVSLAEPFAGLLLEQRLGLIQAVPSAFMPEPRLPDEATLGRFHAETRASWTVPERRAWREAPIEPATFVAEVQPTEAEVEAYYRANPAEFGGVPLRDLVQVVFPTQEAAQAFAVQVRSGVPFAEAAAAAGFQPADTAVGRVSELGFADQTNAAVARAAFAAAAGAVTDPIRGPLGWHVVKVEEILPLKPIPLAAAHATIAAKLMAAKTEKLLAERVAAIEDRFAAGEPLGEVARAFGLEVREVPPTTADGQRLDAKRVLVPATEPLVSRAFAADVADGPMVVEAQKGRFVLLEVTEVIPPAPLPLAEIRDRVLAAWQMKARSDAARAVADALAAEAGRGGDLAALARARGLPAPQPLRVRRLELTQMAAGGSPIPPPVLLLLNVPQGEARVVAAPGGQGWFVVKTVETRKGDAAEAGKLVESVRQGMARDAANELAETFARAIQREVRVVRQPAGIAAVKRRLAGGGAEAPAP